MAYRNPPPPSEVSPLREVSPDVPLDDCLQHKRRLSRDGGRDDKRRRSPTRDGSCDDRGDKGKEKSGHDLRRTIRQRIAWLNNEGGFDNAIHFDKVHQEFEAAGIREKLVLETLEALADANKRGRVENPTSWVCNGLRKAAKKQRNRDCSVSQRRPRLPRSPSCRRAQPRQRSPEYSFRDRSRSCRRLRHSCSRSRRRPLHQRRSPERSHIRRDYHERREDSCSRRHRRPLHGRRSPERSRVLRGYRDSREDSRRPRSQARDSRRHDRSAKGKGKYGHDWARTIRRRIAWLNNEGGFNNAIHFDQVREDLETSGISEQLAMETLDALEDANQRGKIENPTGWICNGFSKAKQHDRRDRLGYGGKETGKGKADHNWDWGRSIRQRIAWLNNEGGFDNAIHFDQVREEIEASGISEHRALETLEALEEADQRESVENPTGWICNGLWKAAENSEGGDEGGQWIQLDDELAALLTGNIERLNEKVFDGAIDFGAVAARAVGIPFEDIQDIFDRLGEQDGVKNPTGWLVKAFKMKQLGLDKKNGGGSTKATEKEDYNCSHEGLDEGGHWVHLDDDLASVLTENIQRLNETRFDGAIDYDAVAVRAVGVPLEDIQNIFDRLCEQESVKNPTGWLVKGLKMKQLGFDKKDDGK